MDSSTGRLTQRQLAQNIADGLVDTIILAYVDQYGQLLGKRIEAQFFLENPQTCSCNYVLTANIEMEPVPGFTLAGWEKGFGDFFIHPDYRTIRVIPWRQGSVLIIGDLLDESGKPIAQSPRAILQRQVAALSEQGMRANTASELEFYLFDSSFDALYKEGPSALRPASNYPIDYHILASDYREEIIGEIRQMTGAAGIPVESSKGETGPGQYEIILRYAPALEMADRHVIYKHGVKAISQRHSKSATFMAKYSHESSGSSCHIHLSLWDEKQEKNLFAENDDLFRSFLAGVMELTGEMFLFYAPTVNSYKRFCPGSFAPVNVSWACDNRTVGYRVVGEGKAVRIENRFPGADANPYLAFAAMLAAGRYGIEQSLKLPDPVEGSAYSQPNLPSVPKTLEEAALALDSSSTVRGLLGDEVVDHYVHHARREAEAYRQQVTSWEVMRYFERI